MTRHRWLIAIAFLIPASDAQPLNWLLAVPRAIEVNASTHAWHSGRVEEMVDFEDGRVLVGTNSGGIWWADANGQAGVLSNDWDDPDVTAVERGPDSQYHVYVATGRQLRESRVPTLDGWTLVRTPPTCGTIRDVAVMKGARRILLACSTGLYWSAVPAPGGERKYLWRRAAGADGGRDLRSLAVKATGSAWGPRETAVAGSLGAAPAMAVVSRSPVHRDLFWVGSDGAVRTAWNVRGGGWQRRDVTAAGAASAGAKIAAVARGESHLDIFFAGPAGELRTTWWDEADGDWIAHTHDIFGRGTAAPASPIAAIARTPGMLDVFWITSGGALMHAQWTGGAWSTPFRVANDASLFTRIALASRTPLSLDVFWVAPGGALKNSTSFDPRLPFASLLPRWSTPVTIAGGASMTGGVSAVSRAPDKLDVVWLSSGLRVMTAWWNDAAGRWSSNALTGPGVADPAGDLALLSRNPLQLDLFWEDRQGKVHANYWHRDTAPSFAAQTYVLDGPEALQIAASSAFDEELTVCAAAATGGIDCKEWLQNDGVVLAGASDGGGAVLLRGTFSGNVLKLAPATITGGEGGYEATSVAVSRYGTAAYAVTADAADHVSLKAVFRSNDLGATWTPTTTAVLDRIEKGAPCTLQSCAGGTGGSWHNTIAVSPTDDGHVYVGWVPMFETTDGAASWRYVESEHIHGDIARVRFGNFDRGGRTAYFATDGGLSATFDGGRSYVSRYNERLTTLQCYTGDATARNWDGTLSASYQVNGLIGAGLQDNGNVWALHGTAWRRIQGGDGGYFTFVRAAQGVMRQMGTPYSRAEWDGSTLVDRGLIPVDRPKSGATPLGGFAIVNDPVMLDSFGSKIFGFAWSGADIYSFRDPLRLPSLVGPIEVKPWRFDFEITAPLAPGETFSAGGSGDGQVSFFGTSAGRIFRYDRRTKLLMTTLVQLTGIPNASAYGINRLTILSDSLGFALLNCWNFSICRADSGFVLKFDGATWRPLGALPDQRYYGLDADWTVVPNTLALTTDTRVLRSTDSGATWNDASAGLPQRAHLGDVRFVVFPNRTKRFYLGTYGRSVWYADVP